MKVRGLFFKIEVLPKQFTGRDEGNHRIGRSEQPQKYETVVSRPQLRYLQLVAMCLAAR
jgi:hypothetical protein